MRWFLFAVLLIGCAPPKEADFADAWAKVACSRQRECDKGKFESDWDDMDDCRTQSASGMDTLMDAADLFGGEYNPENAGDCLSAMRSASCEEVRNGDYDNRCDNIYD